MRAIKANKEYTIDESQKKSYQDMGFDILDGDGKIIAYGRGKTVSYGDYAQACDEIKRLNAKISESEGDKAVNEKRGTKKAGE